MKEEFMDLAINLARESKKIDEVPVGAVIVLNGEVIGEGFNQKEKLQDPTAHAEILAIRKASTKLNSWHLENAEMYVTLEPCIMCAGAILSSRIKRVYFGAFDEKDGASYILEKGQLNHSVDVFGGIKEDECRKLIKEFFKDKRV